MRSYAVAPLFLAFVMVMSCTTTFITRKGSVADVAYDDAVISALGAVGRMETAISGPLFEGDGGADIRLAVLAPEAHSGVPDYLPLYIQGLLNNNFKKYSALTLIDRQNLNRIISEQNLGANGRFSEDDFMNIGALANTQYFVFGSIQKLYGGRYSLQLSIIDSATGARRADSMKDGTLAQLEGSGALINEVSVDLLGQMGVQLSQAGKHALLAGNWSAVQTEAMLARGIVAQAAGAETEALFNFSQSIAFDPSQAEALTRLNLLSSTISEGSISQGILIDLQARDRWLEAFKETARLFHDHPPFEITFDPNLVQEGHTNYVRRKVNLAMHVALNPSEAGFGVLNTLLEGLEKTGMRRDWGFAGWPLLDIHPRASGTVVFDGKKAFSFKVEALLLNENNLILGRSSVTLNTGNLYFSAGDTRVNSPDGDMGLMRFININADDLTPVLIIVITAVNGIPSHTLNSTGYMKIDAGNLENSLAFRSVSDRSLENFALINGGAFTMGSPANEPGRNNSEGQWQVTVSSFYMGKYEVTQKEYHELMGTNPSNFRGSNNPVEQVSWFDAVEYCNKRSQREWLIPAYTITDRTPATGYPITAATVTWNRDANGYRLPTEAEWEYACRAGTTTAFNTGNNITTSQANYDGNYPYNNNAKGEYRQRTMPVGSFEANPWGLYDMHGNVSEWCWDWYDSYPSEAQTDPTGAAASHDFDGSYRVLRGGSWGYYGHDLRSAYRSYDYPYGRYDGVGFRLLRQ